MLCHEVATHFQARGHQVSVLTSNYGVKTQQDEPGIYRRLKLESDVDYYRPQQVLHYWIDQNANYRAVETTLAQLSPDIVVIWGMWNLSRRIATWLETLAGSKVVYYLADVWPAEPGAHESYWDGTANSLAGRAFKHILRGPIRRALRREWRPFDLHLEHVVTCSRAVRDSLTNAGVPVDHAQVIYHGIDPELYRRVAEQRKPNSGNGLLRVVYVGSLLPHKGVHTAIEAFGHLAESGMSAKANLTILGAGHPQYEDHLHQLVKDRHLEQKVTFRSPIPRSELPAFLAQFDVLVMPSIYEEPQARISQEAMASGLVLVATLTGGTKEILIDGVNGVAFEPENAAGLAMQLQYLGTNAHLRRRLVAAGRQTVEERFTITQMINNLESYLIEIISKVGGLA
jgi:glycosyltransferase involved in cell wall biosynthesis